MNKMLPTNSVIPAHHPVIPARLVVIPANAGIQFLAYLPDTHLCTCSAFPLVTFGRLRENGHKRNAPKFRLR